MSYLKNGCFFIIRSFFIIFGIIAICSLPQLFFGKSPNPANSLAMQPTPTLQFNLSNYLDSILNVISSLFHPTTITYNISNAGIQSPDRDLFPYLLESYNHTLIIMICAFLIAVLLSTTFTILTFYFPKHIQTIILKILHVLEALPDLFFVVCVQLFVIWIYKNTSFLVTVPFSTMQEKTYLLPILTLSILPIIFLYKISLLNYKDELQKDYVNVAVAKGLKPFYILYKHVLINALLSIFYNAKSIFLFMISNMIVLEYLFNSYGLFKFLIMHQTPEIVTISILLLTIPFYLSFELLKRILPGRRDLHV
ncbi:ABC transporter permease subunit [Bacillus paramycoides]|uniref:ABC transporter permease subunit n=1 Tax=Bacillus paramycoides TaxID=2026194 RepID=UPI002E1C4C75|nr:ABC transporter permease subunit [Bacillus paramycoides]MED0987072.1 ABC transporter permease subunit [Bacillus paramycoides]